MLNNQTILIIEGHDNSGKTSLIKKLSDETGIPSYKRADVKKNYDFVVDLFYSVDAYLQFVEQTGYSIIFDRLYPSEYVYSTICGRHTSISKILELDKRFAELGAVIIILEKDEDKYKPDDIIALDKYNKIKESYREFSKLTQCKCLIINSSDEDSDKQLGIILDFLEKIEKEAI